MFTLHVLGLIITLATSIVAYHQMCLRHRAELALFDEKQRHQCTSELLVLVNAEKTVLSRQVSVLLDERTQLTVALHEEQLNGEDLLRLNHQMGVATLQAETERAAVQKELTRLHQRFYLRNSLNSAPLMVSVN